MPLFPCPRDAEIDRKLRALELRARAATRHGTQHTKGTPTIKQRNLQERQLTQQAELAYQRLIQDWQATATRRNGAGAAPGAHLKGRQAAQQRGRQQPQNLRFSWRSPAPTPTIPCRKESVHSTLDFHA